MTYDQNDSILIISMKLICCRCINFISHSGWFPYPSRLLLPKGESQHYWNGGWWIVVITCYWNIGWRFITLNESESEHHEDETSSKVKFCHDTTQNFTCRCFILHSVGHVSRHRPIGFMEMYRFVWFLWKKWQKSRFFWLFPSTGKVIFVQPGLRENGEFRACSNPSVHFLHPCTRILVKFSGFLWYFSSRKPNKTPQKIISASCMFFHRHV